MPILSIRSDLWVRTGQVGTTETIARALSGKRTGSGWVARCPAHDDRTPSLSMRDADDGKVLVYCHAGCRQDRVIAALKARGLWAENSWRYVPIPRRQPCSVAAHGPDLHEIERRNGALAIWEAAITAQGTLVETYLAARGIRIPPPPSLRFHPGLKHPTGGLWPAMVGLVANGADGTSLAIHRTFLAHDGSGKAPVDQAKMMLGPCSGGVVRLAEPIVGKPLFVGEGIETCLAAMQAGPYPTWAALSTSGLRSLILPNDLRARIVILADGDDAGESAAQSCAQRWIKEGRRVCIARPPKGMDFNDLVMAHASRKIGWSND